MIGLSVTAAGISTATNAYASKQPKISGETWRDKCETTDSACCRQRVQLLPAVLDRFSMSAAQVALVHGKVGHRKFSTIKNENFRSSLGRFGAHS